MGDWRELPHALNIRALLTHVLLGAAAFALMLLVLVTSLDTIQNILAR
jgi:hypothetical protein